MDHIKNLFVRGKPNSNGKGSQWIPIGKLYKDGEKLFIAMDAIALSPSLLIQVEDVERTIPVGLYDPSEGEGSAKQGKAATPTSTKQKGAGVGFFHNIKDDIPF